LKSQAQYLLEEVEKIRGISKIWKIDIPKAQGPDGRDLGSAKWTLNGKVVWKTELHKTGESS
jgi:hypothetical protein